MYSNLTLYYLNQIGIRPWIKREVQEQLQEKPNSVKVAVFVSSTLSTKARSLLQQMIRYLNLNEDELTVIPTQKEELHRYASLTPFATLVFGLSQEQLLAKEQTPVFNTLDLDYLLSNPKEKRTVFKVLSEIKQLVS
ncbi:DNA polymerase III subunit psi [Legionella lytica]|uniref:DNA polymerase III subunit psi n=1 Tax=Legionella lytica TaxID=96232 RepID=A0ABY4Y6T9_9GAMM|nr:DNA polymerase III subunit psi [Legionella lytica]USQ12877.1 DNA polymerase III subunit psi [Legionella lytica]